MCARRARGRPGCSLTQTPDQSSGQEHRRGRRAGSGGPSQGTEAGVSDEADEVGEADESGQIDDTDETDDDRGCAGCS